MSTLTLPLVECDGLGCDDLFDLSDEGLNSYADHLSDGHGLTDREVFDLFDRLPLDR